ncbi:hypothetical protein GBL_0470 [Geobacillus kaustophilus GBlys]|uniref:Uncharacterized protein n=1 Tax=Geobacillus kaustophilus GBlys TaxID=1337888 RepID=S4NH43_GEOKU|nr:hypothetical protein GBL_0470 [Geobacillus kaustophilus GBlys]GAJ59363.1 hypothetical protein B23_2588 [Geobacillus thermoleovorans B23]
MMSAFYGVHFFPYGYGEREERRFFALPCIKRFVDGENV